MTEKLTNSVTSSFDDDLYDFAKADAQLRGLELAGYIRCLVDKERNIRFGEVRVFNNLMNKQK